MVANQEGIGVLKLQCPQGHPVGRVLKDAPHQSVLYDPGAVVGPRRFWPDEDEQPNFKAHCRFCDLAGRHHQQSVTAPSLPSGRTGQPIPAAR